MANSQGYVRQANERAVRLVKRAVNTNRQNACENKQQWDSRALAQMALTYLLNQNPGDEYSVYRCRYCDGWHVGHVIRRDVGHHEDGSEVVEWGQTSSLNSARFIYCPPFLAHNEIRRRRFAEMEYKGSLIKTDNAKTMNDRWWEWENLGRVEQQHDINGNLL